MTHDGRSSPIAPLKTKGDLAEMMLQLRLTDPKNNQRTGIRFARDDVEI